jgi:hypothetical protein
MIGNEAESAFACVKSGADAMQRREGTQRQFADTLHRKMAQLSGHVK